VIEPASLTPRLTRFIPQRPTPKQAAFLLLPHEEAFFGGSAGPGKSSALLMSALQYADVPGYACLGLRRTFADLSLPGALMDRARDWLAGTGAKWNGMEHTWRFPAGASMTFGYCESEADVYRYQGAEFQCVFIDELTEWSERAYTFLFSRLRRLKTSQVPIRMRSASNPGNEGHAWVRARFIDPAARRANGRAFIPARLSDNPHIDREAYVRSLMRLDPVTRQRLLEGDWEVADAGTIFRRDWFKIGDPAPNHSRRVRFWDMAATAGDGCLTVGTRMALDMTGSLPCYVVESVVSGQWAPGERDDRIRRTADEDGKNVVVAWEEEPGSSGKSVTAYLGSHLRGFRLAPERPTGKKVVRWGPLASQAQLGHVRVVPGTWTGPWLDALCAADDTERVGADEADSAAGAFHHLTAGSRGAHAPVIASPSSRWEKTVRDMRLARPW
jgi:phage terminase large subunit-like protein